MAEKKTGAAKHSADYRDRKRAEAERLGIETLPVESAAGTRAELTKAMKVHGYTQLQELLQDLHRSFIAADRPEQTRRLKRPDAPAFKVSPKLARRFAAATRAELRRNPGDEIEAPKTLPHGEQQCREVQVDILN
ncbi:hypothetical protein DN388_16080 [Pseudomonas sp. S12(2018)]|uniref:hypothetical protein n=1 Tax=Pseudomonas sp. S12(2018) TaxID=2219664 RepID=UPI001E30437B|nr:hypothetical protein [Pseudomonas sp. S12(2018)]MCQ0168476.1 hypothetical protein [Pseudomonas sp. S12(2018)]